MQHGIVILMCYVNILVIHSIALMLWLLALEVLRIRGIILRNTECDVVDFFFSRYTFENDKKDKRDSVLFLTSNETFEQLQKIHPPAKLNMGPVDEWVNDEKPGKFLTKLTRFCF